MDKHDNICGGCCCNCRHRTLVAKHSGESILFACTVEHSMFGSDGAERRSLLLSDFGHGFCEMYTEIENAS